VRLLLPRSGYAPQQKSGPHQVGIAAEADNNTLGGLFVAGWSVLHALAHTPPAPCRQVGPEHGSVVFRLMWTFGRAVGFLMLSHEQTPVDHVPVVHDVSATIVSSETALGGSSFGMRKMSVKGRRGLPPCYSIT
jgi:hypothetical protein